MVPQIKLVLNSKLETILCYLKREKKKNFIQDSDSGILFKSVAEKYPHKTVLSFTLNVDGAEIFRSSKNSLWPVQLYQNYLPPKIRYRPENILLVTLYYAKKKPNPFHLVSLFAKEIDECDISIFDGNQFIDFVPVILTASCDIPARALLQNMKLPTGKSACPVSTHPGEAIANLKGGKTIRYLKRDGCELRTHNDTVQKASMMGNSMDSIDGIKGFSCMLMFDDFNVIESFAIDFMHNIPLGVVKTIMEIWIGFKILPPANNNLKIKLKNNKERKLLSERIAQLKPLMHFRRKPRPILDLPSYKATELLNLLLYYIRFAVTNLLPTKN